jgi:ABC-type amino acid transport substrate-binding protein
MRLKKLLETSLALAAVCALLSAEPGSGIRTIRMGFPEIPGIYGVGKDGKRFGYFYELQETLASRLGWKIEYLNASWDTCLTLLDSGDIDLLGFVGRDFTAGRLYDYSTETAVVGWSSILLQAKINYSGIGSSGQDGRPCPRLGGNQ